MNLVKRAGYLLGLPILLITAWSISTTVSPNFFVPHPFTVVATFVDVWVGERFFLDVLPSVGRLLMGLLIAVGAGIVLGLFIGSVRWVRSLLEPLLEFIRAIPSVIMIPVLLLLIGINDTMKVVVIVFGCIWPVLLNTIEGVRAVDPVLSDTARVYGIAGTARTRYLTIRSASPQIMAGVRQSLSIALVLMVISEMFAASEGIGFAIVQFQRRYAIPEMWSGMVVLGILGVTVSLVFKVVQGRVLAWYYGLREVENG